jgi:hypothetical protein
MAFYGLGGREYEHARESAALCEAKMLNVFM